MLNETADADADASNPAFNIEHLTLNIQHLLFSATPTPADHFASGNVTTLFSIGFTVLRKS
jgi:hypothetical protein